METKYDLSFLSFPADWQMAKASSGSLENNHMKMEWLERIYCGDAEVLAFSEQILFAIF